MTLVPEWNALQPGIVIGVIGFITLAIMVFTYCKMEHKTPLKISGKVVLIALIPMTRGVNFN